MTAYNLSLYDNATGIMGILDATNYQMNGWLILLVVLSLSALSFWILLRHNEHPVRAVAISSFGCLLISLVFRIREFQGVPMMPDWFILMNIIVLGFSVAGIYLMER